ncbi:Crp/Fnr family transcriptional regulator [Vibrio sp. SCSIO 43137]|uniref:Crp/Fnr family transcriptional regulator n=1 Tax=Vibrio sp. SCSIO 43137 TaxID=3021011 RepID=UPI002307B926|nr:Crp/Fnr family transcriptional regulator [Vibrio sp. SCSIO 43137]WCE30774.1 Crp/Fnr family transcriptional regulator [Vibrio sp. SCSIO 43137]
MERVANHKLKMRFARQFHLDSELPAYILDNLQLTYLEKGEHLYHQNNKLEFIYFLLQGKLQVDSSHKDGSHTTFSFETPFSILGDLELFEEMNILSNVIALENCYLFSLSTQFLKKEAYNDPLFLRFIIRYIRKKLNFSVSIHNKVAQPLEYRVACYLSEKMKFEGEEFMLESRSSIASMFGVSVRHLNRVLKKLEQQGAIELRRKQVRVISHDTLFSSFR